MWPFGRRSAQERTQRIIAAALQALGDDSTKVAKTLRAMGVRGNIADPERCPVSNYLRRVLGASDVRAGFDRIAVSFDDTEVELPTPVPVAGFVRAHDLEEHPELIERFERRATAPPSPATELGVAAAPGVVARQAPVQ